MVMPSGVPIDAASVPGGSCNGGVVVDRLDGLDENESQPPRVAWSSAELEQVVLRCIAHVSGVELASVSPAATLEEVGLDSMAISEVLVAIEDELGQQLPDELLEQIDDYEQFETVNDVLQALRAPTGTA
jgi:acyl carrier protein